MNENRLSILPLFLAFFCGASIAAAQEAPAEIVLQAKVRDFKEANPTDSIGTHPHFNTEIECSAKDFGVNTVEAEIDTTGPLDGGLYAGDKRTPKLINPLAANIARCYNPPGRFPEWYSDQAASINRAFLVDLRFKREAAGVYRFRDTAFFPIDDGKSFKKFAPGDPGTFGHLQIGSLGGTDLATHNYGFTMELHTEFLYDEGKGQIFTFAGDDDIWAFINGKRVLDLGGVHQTESGQAHLDSLKTTLGLENGKKYPLDFFFAERHTSSSACTITTNIDLITAIPVVATPVADPAPNQAGTYPMDVTLSTATPSAKIYYTLDGSVPDSTKTAYTSAVRVSGGTVLKAIAYRAGWIVSPIMTASYPVPTGISPRASALRTVFPGARTVAIFDRTGRLVRNIPFQTGSGGTPAWDHQDAQGRQASPGVYFWRSGGSSAGALQSGLILLY